MKRFSPDLSLLDVHGDACFVSLVLMEESVAKLWVDFTWQLYNRYYSMVQKAGLFQLVLYFVSRLFITNVLAIWRTSTFDLFLMVLGSTLILHMFLSVAVSLAH
jgi:hypothetical protein